MENKRITLKNSWEGVTLQEFEQIEQILVSDIPEDYKLVNLLAVLSGESPSLFENLPISTFTSLVPKVMFVTQELPQVKVRDNYIINGHRYKLDANIPSITTAQYIDYQTYMKESQIDLQKVISVFLIPEGHKYNDGYDMSEVLSDIHQMKIVDVKAIGFFIQKQSALFILATRSYLQKQMEGMGIPKNQINKDLDPLNSLAFSLIA